MKKNVFLSKKDLIAYIEKRFPEAEETETIGLLVETTEDSSCKTVSSVIYLKIGDTIR